MVANQTQQTETKNATVWDADVTHSSAEFAVRHMMIATVRGTLNIKSATVTLDEANPDNSRIEAELDAASVNTGTADRDNHLRSADFFDAEKFPTLKFVSTRFTPKGDDEYEVEGNLTIRDVTKPVVLHVEKGGEGKDPWGKWRAGVTATTTIDRTQWGLTWNMALEAGGILVADKVKITLDVQVVRRD